MKKFSLFITSYSLSSRSAIGVQTKHLLEEQDDWLHFHWWTSDFVLHDPRSLLIDNLIVARVSRFHRPGLAAQLAEQCHISWWKNNSLRPSKARQLLLKYLPSVSAIYLAPLTRDDAIRCRSLAELFAIPFILHIWDFLDAGPETPEFLWLIRNAAHVFCLSEQILEAASVPRPKRIDLLAFTRSPSEFSACAPIERLLRINLIGNLGAYRYGLDVLCDAVELLKNRNLNVSIIHIGDPKLLLATESRILSHTTSVGFLQSDAERDRILSESHLSFLPGPSAAPSADSRSKYSIPSRILDFLAIGTPIVGTVHPDSAAGSYLGSLGIGSGACCLDAAELATAIARYFDVSTWSAESQTCKNAFRSLMQASPGLTLKNRLKEIEARI